MSQLQQENNMNSMTGQVAGTLDHPEKRNALDWLRDKISARAAGLLYFVNGAAGFFSYMIVSKRLIVQGNATATAHNILGVLLIAACFGYLANALTLLLVPGYAPAVSLMTVVYIVLGAAGEGSTLLWLLIKGVKVQR